MILFLDVVSPCPQFVLLDNDKIIRSIHILDKNIIKISDGLLSKYLKLERKYDLFNKIDKLIVSTGPGSFTSLRVGISFMYGQSISKDIPFYGISSTKLLNYSIKRDNYENTLLLVCSANNQNFICIPCKKASNDYKIHKINDTILRKINFDCYTSCISNYKIPDDLKKKLSNINNFVVHNVEENVNLCVLSNLKKEQVISPIYISDNKLLN